MAERFFYAGNDPAHQAAAVEMLCRCFDEWVDFSQAYGKRFPFHEESFVCYDENQLLGHVGIMPFEIFDDKGGTLRCAGLASVGTDPEARGRGIAHQLCSLASEWAEAEGFDLMLLYTNAGRVYEKSSWQKFTAGNIALKNPVLPPKTGKTSDELTDKEKALIVRCYESQSSYPGKVKRTSDGKFFHSWQWLSVNPLARWVVSGTAYALIIDNVLAETAGTPDPGFIQELSASAGSAFLSPGDPAVEMLKRANWQSSPASTTPACWHGESAMYKLLNCTKLPDHLVMPLADKF